MCPMDPKNTAGFNNKCKRAKFSAEAKARSLQGCRGALPVYADEGLASALQHCQQDCNFPQK